MGTRWSGLAVLVTLLGRLLVAGAAEAQGELFVLNGALDPSVDSITVYSRTASGNAAPLRTLRGPAMRLDVPIRLAVDVRNNELVVLNRGDNDNFVASVTAYSRTASGNTAPLRILSGPRTGRASP